VPGSAPQNDFFFQEQASKREVTGPNKENFVNCSSSCLWARLVRGQGQEKKRIDIGEEKKEKEGREEKLGV
jgi:hypothetical protein